MPWKAISAFTDSLKGKYVRFDKPHNASNLSNQFNINKSQDKYITVGVGAIGKIYDVRGATLFVGFSKDLRTPPLLNTSPTGFGATMQFYIDDIEKIRIDE